MLPESLVERVGFDDVHLLAERGRVGQPERVGLERLVRNVLKPAGEHVASTTNKYTTNIAVKREPERQRETPACCAHP